MPAHILSRLFYASTATEHYSPLEIGDILEACRRNNPTLNVTGMLFFGNGYFLQCLEGSRANVNTIYHKITADQRHTDIQLLEFKEVGTRYFADWTMKYVRSAAVIEKILKETRMKEFNPYELDTSALNMMAEAFRAYIEPTTPLEKEGVAVKKKSGLNILDMFKRS
jgi:Sensors of blue-light using FAD